MGIVVVTNDACLVGGGNFLIDLIGDGGLSFGLSTNDDCLERDTFDVDMVGGFVCLTGDGGLSFDLSAKDGCLERVTFDVDLIGDGGLGATLAFG